MEREEQMRDLFGNEILEKKEISRGLIANAITDELCGITAEKLSEMLSNKVDAIVEFARLCNGENSGQKISLLFNPHRMDTATNKGKSLIAAMQDRGFCSGLARALAWKNDKVKELLYQCIQLGINGVQYVNEFPPHIARDVYMSYSARRVLDPCAGWGGRMIGAAAVGAFYHGFEPSTKTHAGLIQLGEFLKSFGNGFDYNVECLPFEDACLTEEYDIALTSPPYYDTEHYSDEPTQARIRYSSYAEFEAGFLLPMVEKASRSSKQGLVLNIGSRQYPMRSTIAKHYNARILTAFKLSGSKGLGKEKEDGEVFIHIDNAQNSGGNPSAEPDFSRREK